VTDSEALNKVIENSGLKLTFIARALKLSREGFYKKLNNQTEFKASEIVKMQEILNLSNEQRDKIFFANQVELKST
jgi:DNA-binding phage protein